MAEHQDRIGRITFPGNPWPLGHTVKEFKWTGKLTPLGEVLFDFHLETEDYDAEAPAAFDEDDDWRSAMVWNNYHACILSSTYWRGGRAAFDGEHAGMRIATSGQPLDFAALHGQEIVADPAAQGELHDDERHHAFGIYLLGHDGVADHRVRFRATADPFRFDIHWSGRIALVYAGNNALNYTFQAQLYEIPFAGFALPDGFSDDEALRLAGAVLARPDLFVLMRVESARMLVPPRSGLGPRWFGCGSGAEPH